jgi:signal transduction histidine kinase
MGKVCENIMRLADFIVSNMESILLEWEAFARTILPAAKMDTLALRDHAGDLLLATVRDMESVQTAARRLDKSSGYSDGSAVSVRLNGASEEHAIGRLGSGFDLLQLVSEYRALRASVLSLWRRSLPQADHHDVDDLNLFHESIDQSLAKAVISYTKRVDQSRDLFLAILSHDLRNPLNSIAVSAALLAQFSNSNADSTQTASQIATNVSLMTRMIGDLLDYTRTRLGAGMPVRPSAVNLSAICQEVFAEYRTGFPDRRIRFESAGDLTGDWDADRLRQMISNLVGNAVQHGEDPIELKLTAEASDVVLVVRNGGPPISPGELPKIFEPLVRGSSAGRSKSNRPGSIGLGLYIAREIAQSHGGTIGVTSTQEVGTTFTVRLPRHFLVKSGQPILDEKHIQTM